MVPNGGGRIALSAAMAVAATWCCAGAGQRRAPSPPAVLVDTFRVVNAYPHDPDAYTQGLVYRDGFLFESTGLNGRSTLRKVKLETGEVVRQVRLDAQYFAEGLTDWKDHLVQLTWQSQLGFVYDLATFASRRTFGYPGEGWGLTHDARHLVVSDGTEWLRFLDPATFREARRVRVLDGAAAVRNLNELEFIGGEIYANVWHTNRIARISPESGRVLGWIDLTGLLSPAYRLDPEAVLNGIAYDAARKRLFVTGKLWPKLFEIEVVKTPR
jgi:glutamine cyclotransferase